jgi:hypothetical protein
MERWFAEDDPKAGAGRAPPPRDLEDLPLPSLRRTRPLRIPWEDETEPISSTPLSGRRVTHPEFGYGTILRESGNPPYEALEVRFDDTILRRVWPKSVKLLDS